MKRGAAFEQQAADWLCQRGLSLLARNYHCRFGELDLVMLEDQILVFVEVRQRSHSQFGGAAASVTPSKQPQTYPRRQLVPSASTRNIKAAAVDLMYLPLNLLIHSVDQCGIKTPLDSSGQLMELEDRIVAQFHNSMDINAHTIEQYTPVIAHAGEILLHCLASDNKILCLGNGASAALSQHFSSLLAKPLSH